MVQYLLRRTLHSIPVIFVISLIVFFVLQLKGDPVSLLAPEYATDQEIAELRRVWGFDRPIHEQYLVFLKRAVRGDFGKSFRANQPAKDLIMERIPATIQLSATALAFSLIVSIPLGVICVVFKDTWIDVLATGGSVLGRAMPNFWVGIMLMLFFGVYLGWVPVSGRSESWTSMILPALTLGFSLTATTTRLMRSSLLEVIGEDYIRTARSKGLSERVVIFKHGLRNALIPVVTVVGLNVAYLLGGAVIVEQVFAWPGMGRLIIQSIFARDMAVVQAAVLMTALMVIATNLAVDVMYSVLDPRISRES